jgi:hypothetical protein
MAKLVEPRRSDICLFLVPAAYALVIFLLGLAIAVHIDFAWAYVSNTQVKALCAATAWVLFWGAWSTRRFQQFPLQMKGALRRPGPTYDEYCDRWQDQIFNPRVCVPIGLAADAALGWWFFHGSSWETYFGSAWAGPVHHDAKALIALILFLPAGPLLAEMLWGYAYFFSFTVRVHRRELVSVPDLAATELRPVTSYGLLTGLGWSVAVVLAIIVLEHRLDSHAVVLLIVVLGAMGFALIIGPQWIAHKALVRLRESLLRETVALMRGHGPNTWVAHNLDGESSSSRRLAFVKDLRDVPVWIYSPTEAIAFVVEVAIPVAYLVLKH